MMDGPSGAMGHWPINVDQIARELGVPEAAVREWTQRESFPWRSGHNGDGPTWFLRDVEDWLNKPEGQEALAEELREHSNG